MKKTSIRKWEILLSILIPVWIIGLAILVTKYESQLTNHPSIPVIWLIGFVILLISSLIFVVIEFCAMKKNMSRLLYIVAY